MALALLLPLTPSIADTVDTEARPGPLLISNTVGSLADLPIEELTRINITTVSRRPQPLSTAPAAIQVISSEEIRRSGASVLPETLRLASNLQVLQVSSNDWAVTARGFSGAPVTFGSLANNMLVMIDGRTVYSPIFGGVFWEQNNLLLDDIERIEIVSGPGATQWGANAVNGVIHIIRKSAADTPGWYGNVTVGSLVEDYSLRYGGTVGDTGFYRVYGQQIGRDALFADGRDEYVFHQGGFRLDLDPTAQDSLTLQGDAYGGREGVLERLGMNGQNLQGIWRRTFSERSRLRLTTFYDRRWRDFTEVDFEVDIWDLDLQHNFPVGDALDIVWGMNFRRMSDEVHSKDGIRLVPDARHMENVNGFVHGEYALIPGRLALILGVKLSDTEFTGVELQPNARLAWQPRTGHLLWSSVSRAVRAPTRFDVDLETPTLAGDPGFDAEKLIAWELGYRIQPTPDTSFSVAAYYNDYQDVRSINANPSPPPDFVFSNDFEAESWGLEVFGVMGITDWWRLRGFYTYFDVRFEPQDPLVVPGAEAFESVDPHHQLAVHSMMDLTRNVQLDFVLRRVTSLHETQLGGADIPTHTTLDARLAWSNRHWEVALIGQSLTGGQHEFGAQKIPRMFFLRTRFWY